MKYLIAFLLIFISCGEVVSQNCIASPKKIAEQIIEIFKKEALQKSDSNMVTLEDIRIAFQKDPDYISDSINFKESFYKEVLQSYSDFTNLLIKGKKNNINWKNITYKDVYYQIVTKPAMNSNTALGDLDVIFSADEQLYKLKCNILLNAKQVWKITGFTEISPLKK